MNWNLIMLISYSTSLSEGMYLEQHVDDEYVEHIFEWVDDAVEDGLQLRHSFDGLEGPQHAENSKRFDRAQILSSRAPPRKRKGISFFCRPNYSHILTTSRKVGPEGQLST